MLIKNSYKKYYDRQKLRYEELTTIIRNLPRNTEATTTPFGDKSNILRTRTLNVKDKNPFTAKLKI